MIKKYLISYEYWPEKWWWLARHAYDIFNRLLKEDDDYIWIIATWDKNKQDSEKLKYLYIKFFDKNILGYFEFALKLYFKYIKYNLEDKYIFFSTFSFLLPFKIFFPKKMYIFIHNTLKRVYITNYPDETLLEKIKRKIEYFLLSYYEKLLSEYSKKIFVVSKSTFDDVTNQYNIPTKKIFIINNGIDLSTFKLWNPKKTNNKNLLFVWRLTSRKNIWDLINIMDILVKTDNSYKLNIVWDWSKKYRNKLITNIEKYNLKKNIKIITNITNDLLNKYYSKSSIFIFSSLVEWFWLVLLEAMSKWLPIIAYNIVWVKDVINNWKEWFLIPIWDYKNFVASIIKFNNKNLYQDFSKNAIKKINDFNRDKSIQLLKNILKD